MARLVVALAAVLLSISAGAAVTVWPAFAPVSGKLMADVGLVREVMSLTTVIAWAAVLSSVWLMRLSGLSEIMLLSDGLSDGIVWAAMLVVLAGVLVVVAWVAVFVFVTGVSYELMAGVVLV